MYELLPAQKAFLEVPHNYELDVAVYQGGFGSGKTFCGSLLGLLLALTQKGIRGLVGANTFTLLRDTTLVSYFEHLENLKLCVGKDFSYIKSEAKLVFKNGSEIIFRPLEDDSRLKSLNLGFVEIEEMSEVPEKTFKMLLGRLRQSGVDRFRLFGHTNPENSKGWIYSTFVESVKNNYRMIFAPSTQNKFLPKGFVDELKKAYDPEYFRINVLGEFGNYSSGLVTKGFCHENVQKLTYMPSLPIHITCDFNVDPMCWVLAHKSDNKVMFFDEIVIENTSTEATVKEFIRRYPEHKGGIVVNGDASGDNRSCTSEFTNYAIIKNILSNYGYRNVRFDIRGYNPPIKNRVAAWNARVKNLAGEVGLFIDPVCEKLLYNVYNLKYKSGTRIIDLPCLSRLKGNSLEKYLGHPFDAASYLVEYYWPITIIR